jgi:hypothetical protein
VEREQRVRAERPQRAEREQRVANRNFERVQRRDRQGQRDVQVNRQAQRFDVQQQRQAQRFERQQQRTDQRFDRQASRQAFQQQQRAYQPIAPAYSVGSRYAVTQSVTRDWYDDVASQRYQTFTSSAPDYYYDYDDGDGYLYQINRSSNLIAASYPLLGGAFGVGQLLPAGYDSYNLPYGYQSLYYDSPDYAYRYGDGAIYRVDTGTQLIQGVVALLTGQRFGVGQMLPTGYDVYNVPYAYREQYFDTADSWYRYDDGFIYQVDPYSRRIEGMYPVSYGQNYAVGYPAPAYASYGGYGAYAGYPSYQVPYAYDNLYYEQPGYDYHFASGGIYQVDPATQLISALVGLVSGTNLSVGQPLPVGYDTYNVPVQYRATYFDRPDALYRYDDGTVYEVNPGTRIVQAAFPLSDYDGWAIGAPIPAGYPAYPVPEYYGGLYYASPDYDYRYYDGGIYQVDRDTQVVSALAALVTGDEWSVGRPLPVGYDAYNVPYAYRERYADDGDSWYRYADGRVVEVDPGTRMIRSVYDLA